MAARRVVLAAVPVEVLVVVLAVVERAGARDCPVQRGGQGSGVA